MSPVDLVTVTLDPPEAPEAVETHCDCRIWVDYDKYCQCKTCNETICQECYKYHETQCRSCDEKGPVSDNIKKANDLMYEKLKEFKKQLEEENARRN